MEIWDRVIIILWIFEDATYYWNLNWKTWVITGKRNPYWYNVLIDNLWDYFFEENDIEKIWNNFRFIS